MTRKKNRHSDYDKKLEAQSQTIQTETESDQYKEDDAESRSGVLKWDFDIVRIALLGIIALTLIFNTFINNPQHTDSDKVANKQASLPQPTNNNPFSLKKTFSDPTENALQPKGPKTKIKFTEEVFDFGDINQNSENHHIFHFKNVGDHPMIISTASGSCGCTVPKWPKEPIAPGGTGEIEVTYSPGTQQGNQTKSVTVFANTEPVQSIVKIKANVHQVASDKAGL